MGGMMLVLNTAFILISLPCFKAEKLSVLPNPITEISEEVAYQKLLLIESNLKSNIESLIKQALPMVLRYSSEVDLSQECMGSLMKTLLALREMKLWAFEMVDASGKPAGGILSGGAGAFGSYHQCVKVVIPESYRHKDDHRPPKTGQYCLVRIRTPLPPQPKRVAILDNVFPSINATFKTELMTRLSELLFAFYDTPLKLGLCIPSTCSAEDLTQILLPITKQLGVYSEVEQCEVKEEFKMDTVQIVILVVLLMFILACLIATILYEIQIKFSSKENNSYLWQVLKSFSIVINMKKLMKTSPAIKASLDSMNGIRYLSATWVILGHSYLIYDRHSMRDALNADTIRKEVFMSVITNAFLSVESFIFVTACLVAYSTVQTFDSRHTYHPVMTLIRRMTRMLPSLMLLTGIMLLIPLLSSGHSYKSSVEDYAESCRINWWTNLVYIGNFVPFNRMCMPHSWYVAVDMQCFLLGIVYFMLLFRNKYWGKVFLGLLIAASVLSSGLVTYFMEYPPAVLIKYVSFAFNFEFTSNVYVLPHVHFGVYAVGLYLGTYVARKSKIKISNFTSVLGWVVAMCSALTIIFAVYPWNNSTEYSSVEAILYSASQRTAWGLCLAWLVFACYAGKGGYVNSLLSWPGFQPLVKTSYLLYLIHVPVYFVYGYTRLGSNDMSHSYFIYTFFGTLCISQILAVFLRLFYEAPLIELERVFCAWLTRNSKQSSKNEVETSQVQKIIYHEKEPYSEPNGTDNGSYTTHI